MDITGLNLPYMCLYFCSKIAYFESAVSVCKKSHLFLKKHLHLSDKNGIIVITLFANIIFTYTRTRGCQGYAEY